MATELTKDITDVVIKTIEMVRDTSPYFLTPLGLGAIGLNFLEYYHTLRRGRIYHNNDVDKLRESDRHARLIPFYDSEGNRLDHPIIDLIISPGRRLAYYRLSRTES